MSLRECALKLYRENNYNCAETILRAGNEYYQLGLNDRDMIMVGGFGAGIQTGNACGAVLGGVCVLSMKYIEAKAHESEQIKPVTTMLIRKFKEAYGSIDCKDIKPQSFDKAVRCQYTIEKACDLLEKTIEEFESSQG